MEETLVPGGDRRRGAQDGRALVVMPSTLSWVFDVGNDYGVARSGTRQHIFPGDQVKNVAKGETGTIERIEGPFLHGFMMIDDSEEYPLPLRLVAIALLIPVDTSECERIFSLMNDIKTAERSLMGSATLRNIMQWHRQARSIAEDGSLSPTPLSCRQLPAMEIVKIFHQLAGEGRYAHRPALRPIYDYEVGFSAQARADRREAESSTAPAPAQAPAPAAMERM